MPDEEPNCFRQYFDSFDDACAAIKKLRREDVLDSPLFEAVIIDREEDGWAVHVHITPPVLKEESYD